MRKVLLILASIALFAGASFSEKENAAGIEAKPSSKEVEIDQFAGVLQNVQSPKREFRSAWITTFSNLDWPSNQTLSPEEQREEFIQILNQLEKSNINAVIVQVRAAADAFYESDLSPWSQWLSGIQGKAPSPYYDPLKFMIEECHKRNMEFHAWLNPFRAVSHNRFSSVAENHISNKQKDWFFDYGETKYFNPGIPEVREHIKQVVREIVFKYDVDGIHFDDYFYPYTIQSKIIPDAVTFKTFADSSESIETWRRENINKLIRAVGKEIKFVKPYVKFGVSPLAIWRNKKQDPTGSETNSGQTSYDNLYCDTKLWLENGWVDYMAPQLYWSTSNPYANYHNLIDWWTSCKTDKHLYIGHALYKLDKKQRHSFETAELVNQVKITREKPTVFGSCYFRARAFTKNHQSFIDTLNTGVYKYPALVPPMKWIDSIPPTLPYVEQLKISKKNNEISFSLNYDKDCKADEKAYYFVVYTATGGRIELSAKHILHIERSNTFKFQIPDAEKIIITALDRLHNETSDFITIDLID